MRYVLSGIVTLLFIGGCGGPRGVTPIPIKTASVNGTATFEGKPLEDYRVYFYSDSNAAQEPASGRIAADGSFALSVRKPNDGAILGNNKIWFSYDPVLPEEEPGRESGKAPPPPKVKLPEKYKNGETSGLSVEVTNAGLKDYKIDLQ